MLIVIYAHLLKFSGLKEAEIPGWIPMFFACAVQSSLTVKGMLSLQKVYWERRL